MLNFLVTEGKKATTLAQSLILVLYVGIIDFMTLMLIFKVIGRLGRQQMEPQLRGFSVMCGRIMSNSGSDPAGIEALYCFSRLAKSCVSSSHHLLIAVYLCNGTTSVSL